MISPLSQFKPEFFHRVSDVFLLAGYLSVAVALVLPTVAKAQTTTVGGAASLLEGRLDRLFFTDFENVPKGPVDELGVLPALTVPDRNLGRLSIQYQGGDFSERSAEVVQDPWSPANSVLLYRISSPNVRDAAGRAERGRVQLNAYGARCLREVVVSVRLMLSPEMAVVKQIPGRFSWLTISEWWNNNDWSTEVNPFRVAVNISKVDSAVGSNLYLQVAGQAKSYGERDWNMDVWRNTNVEFPVPVGKWITIQYYFKDGDKNSGRFAMNAGVEGGPLVRVFDIKDYTHSPFEKNSNGLTQFNPMKLYTSNVMVNAVKRLGGEMKVAWDDLDIRANQQTAGCVQ